MDYILPLFSFKLRFNSGFNIYLEGLPIKHLILSDYAIQHQKQQQNKNKIVSIFNIALSQTGHRHFFFRLQTPFQTDGFFFKLFEL